jgi:hypothetical protein
VVPRRVEGRHEADDFFDAHPAVHLLVFGEVTDASPHLQWLGRGIEPQHADLALIALQQAQQHADGSRLAGAVPTEKRKRLAPLDSQRQVAQHLRAAE